MSDLLAAASGLTRTAIDHYFHGRPKKLGGRTVRRLDELCAALGETVPGARQGLDEPVRRTLRSVRVAILLDLHNPPSPRFHLECLESVLTACEAYNFSVSLHQFSGDAAGEGPPVARIVRSARPEAVVWFRLSPSFEALNVLRRSAPETPAIVVCGARLDYESPPVLTHIFPSQIRIRQDIAGWAACLREAIGDGYVVVAHMPREMESHDLPTSPDAVPSIRNERIDLIAAGIKDAGLRAELREVPDYAASRAFRLVRESEDAVGFVCLADELCLGVLHQLEARGVRAPTRRLVGFDDSTHSREFGICSFSQHLPWVGQRMAEALADFFRHRELAKEWPAFREEPIPVELIPR
jgi:DNA-binding LacI/PurR family transcriptional regulator